MQEENRFCEALTPDDVKFLTELANELKTQDCVATAKPVVFKVMETKKRVAMDPAYSDGMVLVLGEDGTEFFEADVAAAQDFLREYEFDDKDMEDLDAIDTIEGLATFCEEKGIDDFHYTGYERYEKFSGEFLTRRACERHIAANRHHYEDPKVYTDYAWRNPEFERLLEIVEKFATK